MLKKANMNAILEPSQRVKTRTASLEARGRRHWDALPTTWPWARPLHYQLAARAAKLGWYKWADTRRTTNPPLSRTWVSSRQPVYSATMLAGSTDICCMKWTFSSFHSPIAMYFHNGNSKPDKVLTGWSKLAGIDNILFCFIKYIFIKFVWIQSWIFSCISKGVLFPIFITYFLSQVPF